MTMIHGESGASPPARGTGAETDGSADERSRSGAAGEGGLLTQLFGRLRPRLARRTREDLAEALNRPDGPEDDFSPAERTMLNGILRLSEVRVEDVMIPRGDIEALELNATLGEALRQFEANGHSRMPVYGESLDDPRGMVHIRDLLAHITRASRPLREGESEGDAAGLAGPDIRQINLSRRIDELRVLRKVLFVPPSMLAADLMARMQAARTQMALVIDEHGGTDGLVSLEDIIEMVVGDISDEHDQDTAYVTESADGVFVVDARADLEDVRRAVGADFDVSLFENDSDSIGGLVVSGLGRMPERGEVVDAVPGFEIQVVDVEPRRVLRLRIVRLQPEDGRLRATPAVPAAES